MFQNSPVHDRQVLRRSSGAVLGILTTVGLCLAASLIGLVFIGLLPLFGAVVLIAVALRAAIEAVPGSPPRPTAAAPLCGSRFAC